MDLRQLADLSLRRRLHHLVLHPAPSGVNGLSMARWRRLADDVGSLLWLDVHGGEPFSHPELPTLLSTFNTDVLTLFSPVTRLEELVRMTTQIRSARQGELVIALALDGLHQYQDRLHGTGSWDRVWRAFDRLSLLDGVRVEIRSVLTRDNASTALALAEYVWQQGVDNHGVTLPGRLTDLSASLDVLRELEGPLFQILDRYAPEDGRLTSRLRRNFQRMRWTTALRTLAEGRQVIPCLAGLSHAVVRANGDVASCDLLPALGNLNEQSWSQIWSGRGLKAQREYIGAGGCSCTDDCALHDSIVLRPQNLPRLLAGTG